MAADLSKQMVRDNQGWIMSLTHGMTWAQDGQINDALETRYHNYSYLSADANTVRRMFQNTINQWKDYMEELYKTTQFEYNPMENYDRWEEGGWSDRHDIGARKTTDTTDVGARSSSGTVNTGARHSSTSGSASENAYGYNSSTSSPTRSTSDSGSASQDAAIDTTSSTVNAAQDKSVMQADAAVDTSTRSFNQYHVHGNIGVRSGQEMVQQSRDIIVDLLDVYVSKFADCFDLRFDLNEVI